MKIFNLNQMVLVAAEMAAVVIIGLLGVRPALAVAYSVVDLNPSGFDWSTAQALCGTQQVGYGMAMDAYYHALLWNGTAESVIDLHQFLAGGFKNSWAYAIDAQNNIVGFATDISGNDHAILWVPVPEPSTTALLLTAALGGLLWWWRRA